MSEIRKNAIWIAVAILIVVLELVGVFDWLYDAILGEDPHIRDAREQQMVEQAYEDGYKDGFSDWEYVSGEVISSVKEAIDIIDNSNPVNYDDIRDILSHIQYITESRK